MARMAQAEAASKGAYLGDRGLNQPRRTVKERSLRHGACRIAMKMDWPECAQENCDPSLFCDSSELVITRWPQVELAWKFWLEGVVPRWQLLASTSLIVEGRHCREINCTGHKSRTSIHRIEYPQYLA